MSNFAKTANLLWPALLVSCTGLSTKDTVKQKPNVIVIVTDDQGYGQLNFDSESYDLDKIKNTVVTDRYKTSAEKAFHAAQTAMPNVTKLANQGVKFTNAFVASPTCGPSRAALITGKYTQKFGVYNNYDCEAGIKADELFLPELFKKNNYKSAMIGKWHLGELTIDSLVGKNRDYHRDAIYGCVPDQHPLAKGFDHYFGFNYHGSNYYNATSLFRNKEHVRSQGYITDEFTSEALDYIEKNADTPFFIYLAYNAPHIPLEERAPRKYQRFDTGNKEVDNYYATLAAVDDGIGLIIAKLKQLNIDKNTIVYFVSDNGAVIDSPLPSNGAFKGNKGLMFQGGVHVPMFVWSPGYYPEAKTITQNVSAMDIIPTALASAQIAIPADVDGVDLNSVINNTSKTLAHEYLFWAGCQSYHWSKTNTGFWDYYTEYVSGNKDFNVFPMSKYKEYLSDPIGTVLKGKYMLHYYPVSESYELYDLENDPGESINIAEQYSSLVKEMRAAFDVWIVKMEAPVEWDKKKWKQLLPTKK